MTGGTNLNFTIPQTGGFILDSPSSVEKAKVLSDNFVMIILQILNSKVEQRDYNSWWSSGVLRQLTFLQKSIEINKRLQPLVDLGMLDSVKISNLPGFSVSKKTLHGILPSNLIHETRRRYVGDKFCYRLSTSYVDLVFTDNHSGILNIPTESMHLENLRLLKYLFKSRTMLLLQALGKNNEPMGIDELTDFLNDYYFRTANKQKIDRFNLSVLPKLATFPFRDNIATKITTDLSPESNIRCVLNRDTIDMTGKKFSMKYSLNFGRIRLYFTNKQGDEFVEKDSEIVFHYPPISDIGTKSRHMMNNLTQSGIIVDIT